MLAKPINAQSKWMQFSAKGTMKDKGRSLEGCYTPRLASIQTDDKENKSSSECLLCVCFFYSPAAQLCHGP